MFHNHANYSFDQHELALADTFISYWSAFARTGDVNGAAGMATMATQGVANKGVTNQGVAKKGVATQGVSPPTTPVHWPRYTGSERLNMRLAVAGDPGGGLGVESSKGEGQPGTAPGTGGVCDFFDSIGYDW